jgi:hypothetical protein
MRTYLTIDSSTVCINNNCLEINDFIQVLFTPWRSDENPPDYEFKIEKLKKGYFLSAENSEVFCDTQELLFSHLEYSLTIVAKNYLYKYLQFHASCVDLNGKGALVVGNQSFGKTTLAVNALLKGFKALGDDIVLIKNGYGEVKGFPRPFKLTDYTLKIIPKDILNKYPHYKIEKDLTYFFFNLSYGNFYSDNTCLKCIIFPVINEGPLKIKQLGQVEALMKIMPHCFNLNDKENENIKRITDLIKNVPSFEISYFVNDHALGFVNDLLK